MRTSLSWMIVATAIVAGCATERGSDLRGPVNSLCNIARQREYITRTQAQIAAYVTTNQPAFSIQRVYTNVFEGVTNRHLRARDTWIPVGENNWLYFVCHSLHSEWNYTYCDVGDLSIGLDKAGTYYFCRSHVCGALSFRLPASGRYSSMDEFVRHNPNWHLLPTDWARLAPPAPAVDITTHIVGTWHASAIQSASETVAIDVEFRDRGLAHVTITAGAGSHSGGTSYEILSAATVVLTNGLFAGRLVLDGLDLTGTIKENDKGFVSMVHAPMSVPMPGAHSHTNTYICRFVKGETGEASSKGPEDTARKLADPQH